MIEDRLAGVDWTPYGALHLDLVNAEAGAERLILQLKDDAGQRFKRDLNLEPGLQHVAVGLAEAGRVIDLAAVAQVNLFRWEPEQPATFLLDAVYLEPRAR
jgi:hypothetical protein